MRLYERASRQNIEYHQIIDVRKFDKASRNFTKRKYGDMYAVSSRAAWIKHIK